MLRVFEQKVKFKKKSEKLRNTIRFGVSRPILTILLDDPAF